MVREVWPCFSLVPKRGVTTPPPPPARVWGSQSLPTLAGSSGLQLSLHATSALLMELAGKALNQGVRSLPQQPRAQPGMLRGLAAWPPEVTPGPTVKAESLSPNHSPARAPLWSSLGLAQGTRGGLGGRRHRTGWACVTPPSLPSEDSDFTFRLLSQLFLIGTCARGFHLLVLGGRWEGRLLTRCGWGLLFLPPRIPLLLLGQESSGQGWRCLRPEAPPQLQGQ